MIRLLTCARRQPPPPTGPARTDDGPASPAGPGATGDHHGTEPPRPPTEQDRIDQWREQLVEAEIRILDLEVELSEARRALDAVCKLLHDRTRQPHQESLT